MARVTKNPMKPLRLRMMEMDYDQTALGEALGRSSTYMSARMMLYREWTWGDIRRMCDLLEIPHEKAWDFFPLPPKGEDKPCRN